MRKNFYFPAYFEGWDNINLYYNFDLDYDEYTFENFYLKYKNYNQNNSHHSKSLYEHCFSVYKYLLDNNKKDIALAGFLHDCGKPYVASFFNKKGEETNECHYYNHNNVSAYESMFYLFNENVSQNEIIKYCTLIQYHMQPYFNNTEKLVNKYKNLWGESLYNDIMILHEADKFSH